MALKICMQLSHSKGCVQSQMATDEVHRYRTQSSDLTNRQMLPTMLKGSNLTVSLMKGVMIDGADSNATVTSANIMADNVRSLQAHHMQALVVFTELCARLSTGGRANGIMAASVLLLSRNDGHDACHFYAKG